MTRETGGLRSLCLKSSSRLMSTFFNKVGFSDSHGYPLDAL